MGWLIVTGAVVLAVIGLSMFALDRPDVVWADAKPHCPQCRSVVPPFSHRCPACREEFDWLASSDETSPLCGRCLTPAQDEFLRQRRNAVGDDKAALRVAEATGLAPSAAAAYLRAVGRGQCGWCGGTGLDLDRPLDAKARCPVCFGQRRCIGCDGDRRVRLGQDSASTGMGKYEELLDTLRAPWTPVEEARKELRAATETFLHRNAGTEETSQLVYWPRFGEAKPPERDETAVDVSLRRLQQVLKALAAD